MEESMNEIEVNQTLQSPPRRRRSTFFEKRESIVPQTLSEHAEPNVCKQTTETADERIENLSRYYEKLLAEKEQWKKEVNSRRNKYHDLRQQYQMALKTPGRSRMSYSALSAEDIEFLKGKANIPKLVESQLKLHKSVKELRALYKRANELDSVIIKHCEEKVDKITEYIFENSTIEPKD
uniref:Uncharacterized protein n=1 Tax=Pectinophora gossypiella TaxID=13191 RepID=A0A1E1WLF2_PECGO